MKQWKKYGSVAICFLSLLLALVGVSQLTFGAYYISKLPVFKTGTPIWIGFAVKTFIKITLITLGSVFDGIIFIPMLKNIVCSAGLFGLHRKALQLRNMLHIHQPEEGKRKRTTSMGISNGEPVTVGGRFRPNHLHWSLGLCLFVVVINLANIIICEVGEWRRWLGPQELADNLISLSQQGNCIMMTAL